VAVVGPHPRPLLVVRFALWIPLLPSCTAATGTAVAVALAVVGLPLELHLLAHLVCRVAFVMLVLALLAVRVTLLSPARRVAAW
ncbi:hypothetical protein, partial [Mumia zhuanghuii]|uniref:hypothetical protein n=1 Tax=Mumia zhuanghuii TaxID=2585211 RepID=UPI001E63A60D